MYTITEKQEVIQFEKKLAWCVHPLGESVHADLGMLRKVETCKKRLGSKGGDICV